MPKRNGGYIGSDRIPAGPFQTDAASGVWVLPAQLQATAAGIWPTAGVLESSNRGIFAGGGSTNVIDYIRITSLGNATDFGDLLQTSEQNQACASSERGVIKTGTGATNVINYITFATTGNALDFGDLTVSRGRVGSCSSSTRGLFAGGVPAAGGTNVVNVIDYITIASVGNATDFGDLTLARREPSGLSSPTRGVFGGGGANVAGSIVRTNRIDYVTIATTGNATTFGGLTAAASGPKMSCASSTRGLFSGDTNTNTNVIEYITIATTGNAVDFGDLSVSRLDPGGACSTNVRGVFGGGINSSSVAINVMDYVTIATTGNAIDFGDLTVARAYLAACSNSHGGL